MDARRTLLNGRALVLLLCLAGGPSLADTLTSDDFSSPNLDPGLWSVVDPRGDASLSNSGGELSIAITAGLEHDVWTSGNMSARIMQATADVDFELEIKFLSRPTERHQMQGILVEGAPGNFLRFDFLGDGSSLRIFAASFLNGNPTVRVDSPISDVGGALYMRIARIGDEWTQRYSYDGTTWIEAGSFSHPLTVARVGAFAGNAGTDPAFTATIDYFFDTAAPIVPEDGDSDAPDLTAPNLFGVDVRPISDSELSVTWSTDEPADGLVEFGMTTGHELGMETNPELATSHSFVIGNLQPENTYQVRFASADAAGNVRYSDNYAVLMSALPTVDVWYGDSQAFGTIGQPQRWINILGNVFDADGLSSLTYSLNGQPEQGLSVGPDNNRLQAEGDFNVEIDFADLILGYNTVDIAAVDSLGNERAKSIDVYYPGRMVWPGTYSIDWSDVAAIEDVAQVVDGLWTLEEDGVRPVALGYDRLIAIGDLLWQEYEITVPVTIHGLDPLCAEVSCAGGSPLLGLLVRWPGHDVSSGQPNRKWTPMGALGVYRFIGEELRIYRGSNESVGAEAGATLVIGGTYFFKMRAETVGGVHRYSLKVWPDDQPEPVAWNLAIDEAISETSSGSAVLVAHHVDATFGDVVVDGISIGEPPPPDSMPPTISNIDILSITDSTASLTWQTDEAADSTISYGESDAYEDGTITDPTLTTSHGMTLSDLSADTVYHVRVAARDAAGNTSFSGDLTFTTASPAPPDTVAPMLSNIQTSSISATQATISWQTDEPSDSSVAFGLGGTYDEGAVSGTAMVTSHSIVLTGLSEETTYHFEVRSTDSSGNSAGSSDLVFTTLRAPGEVESDEFSGLDGSLWAWTDPIGDASVTASDGRLRIAVPGGVDHDVWTNANEAPRLRQYVIDGDFEIEVKFDSEVTQKHQLQGILVEQDDQNLIRFDFYSTGSQTKSFVATFIGGTPTTLSNATVPSTAPMYMRVKREGDLWTQWVSSDGINWTPLVSFNHPIFVTTVGVFAGNVGSPAPAHEALIDYFRVVGEDLPADTVAPVISDIQVASLSASQATITWQTDEPSDSTVRYGVSTGYELGDASDGADVTTHSIVVSGLSPQTTYHYRVGSSDGSRNSSSSGDLVFTTASAGSGSGMASDDFSGALDTSVWTLSDPLGDSSVATSNGQLVISVPGGSSHDIWNNTNDAPRLRQYVVNSDFEIEVKFDSPVTEKYQLQGILVEQDDGNLIRFDFYSTNSRTKSFAATFVNGSATVLSDATVSSAAPMYMRIKREGDLWTQSISSDGVNWTTLVSFTHAIYVTTVGVFGGNVGGNAPAHTALIDYFHVLSQQ